MQPLWWLPLFAFGAEDTTKAGKGTGVVIGKNKGQIMHTKLSACQLNIFRDRMVSLFGN